MLSINVLSFTAEHGQCEGFLDEMMPVDRRGNRVNNLLANVGLAGQVFNLLLVLLCQLDDVLVSKSSDVVRLNNRGENRETVLDIREIVKSIDVDTSDFNLITWSGSVNHVIQNINFFLSGDTTWRDGTRGLLNSHLLIVSVDSVDFIYCEGAIALANYALAEERLAFMSI